MKNEDFILKIDLAFTLELALVMLKLEELKPRKKKNGLVEPGELLHLGKEVVDGGIKVMFPQRERGLLKQSILVLSNKQFLASFFIFCSWSECISR